MLNYIINPLLQSISFIVLWYLYSRMGRVTIPWRYLGLIYLSYLCSASYFGLVKIVIDPLFFLILDLALVKERSLFQRLLFAFYPTILFDVASRFLSLMVLPFIFNLETDASSISNFHLLTYLLAPLIIYLFVKIFAVDLVHFSNLDDNWMKRNWARGTAFLAFYYVFFTVIHGLNNVLVNTNDPRNLFEIVFQAENNRFLFLGIYLAILLWDFYNWNYTIHHQMTQQLDEERGKLLTSITNYNRALTQIFQEKQKSTDTFKGQLAKVKKELEANQDQAALYQLEHYRKSHDNTSIAPHMQEQLNRISNPVMASFIANRILDMQHNGISYSLNVSPHFGLSAISDLDLYQLLQISHRAIKRNLLPESELYTTYLQMDDSQVLLAEYPSKEVDPQKDKELTEFVKAFINVEYRVSQRDGYFSQMIIIHEQGHY